MLQGVKENDFFLYAPPQGPFKGVTFNIHFRMVESDKI